MHYVLDSWAVIAFLDDEEPAASHVSELFGKAHNDEAFLTLSVINLGEVFYIIGRKRGHEAAEKVMTFLEETVIDIHQISQEDVINAARFKMNHPISYADAFAAATASMLDATLVTGDPELIALSGLIDVEPLSRK